ncbi:ead/Ea22-like family protein [Escherichia coli]|nr:ead/Ea22-like family protein [Escherichia coli]
MSGIDYQALREAAEKAGEDKWQAKKINGDFFVIRHGSYTRQHGYTSYQPIAEIDCKPVRDFVAKANPAPCLRFLMNWKLKANALQSWRKKLHQIRLASSVKIFEHRIIE